MQFIRCVATTICLVVFVGCTQAQSADEFEVSQTAKLFGVGISDYPFKGEKPQLQPVKLAGELRLSFTEQDFNGDPLPEWFKRRSTVTIPFGKKETVAAYCGYAKDGCLMGPHGFNSELATRRHRYGSFGGMEFFPKDVFVGKVVDDKKIIPILQFRDVGSHEDDFAIALDSAENAHLIVSDILRNGGSRLKVYWAVGNLSEKKWKNLFLIEQHRGRTVAAVPRASSTTNAVHVVLSTVYRDDDKDSPRMVHYSMDKEGKFGEPVCIDRDFRIREFDVAASPATDTFVVVYSTDKGVFFLVRQDSQWRRSQLLPKELRGECRVSVQCTGDDTFRVRVANDTNRQFEIKVPRPPQK